MTNQIVLAFKRRMTWKGHDRTPWGDENILYLDFVADYMGVNICQKWEVCFRFGPFTMYNLLPKKEMSSYYFLINFLLIWPLTRPAFHPIFFSFFPDPTTDPIQRVGQTCTPENSFGPNSNCPNQSQGLCWKMTVGRTSKQPSSAQPHSTP